MSLFSDGDPILKNMNARALIIPTNSGFAEMPFLESCLKIGEAATSVTDNRLNIYCPSINRYGIFDWYDAAVFNDQIVDTVTVSLSALTAKNRRSGFNYAAKNKYPFDLIIAFGSCGDPNDFATYDKVEIYYNCRITNHMRTELTDWDGPSTESVVEEVTIIADKCNIVARHTTNIVTEIGQNTPSIIGLQDTMILPQEQSIFSSQTKSLIGRDPGRVILVSEWELGIANGRYVVNHSLDGGDTWTRTILDGADPTSSSVNVSLTGSYRLLVLSFDVSNGIQTNNNPVYYYNSMDGVIAGDPWKRGVDVSTISRSAGGVSHWTGSRFIFAHIDGRLAYATTEMVENVGNYKSITNPGFPVINDIDSSDDSHVYFCGNSGEVGKLLINNTYQTISSPTVDDILTISVIGDSSFFIGTIAGEVWYTEDDANTWYLVANHNQPVRDIVFEDKLVGIAFLEGPPTPGSRVMLTIDGGRTWRSEYESSIPTFTQSPSISLIDGGNMFVAPAFDRLIIGRDEFLSALAG